MRRHSAHGNSTALRLKGSRSASAFLFARNELNAVAEAAVHDVASAILQELVELLWVA